MGYSPEELVGTNSFDYIHPEDVETATDALVRVLEHPDREIAVGFRAEHADGTWRDLDVPGRNLLDDELIEGIVVSARDVTGDRDGSPDESARD